MKTRLYLFFFTIGLISACSQQYPLNLIENDATIVALGDSLTYGTGSEKQYNYPSVLEGLIYRKVINEGIPGNKTRDVLNRLDNLLTKHNPDLVILCIGGNDFIRRVSKNEVKQNILAIISQIRTQGSQVMMIAVPEPGLFLGDAKLYQEISDEAQVPLLKDVLSDLLSDNNFKSDAIHLNKQGYTLLAQNIHQFLIERGAIY